MEKSAMFLKSLGSILIALATLFLAIDDFYLLCRKKPKEWSLGFIPLYLKMYLLGGNKTWQRF